MQNDLISRSDAIKRAKAAEIKMESINGIKAVPVDSVVQFLSILPAVDAVSRPVVEQIQWERDFAMQQLKDHGISFGGIDPDVVKVVRCEQCLYRSQYANEEGLYKCGAITCKEGHCAMVAPHFSCIAGKKRGKDDGTSQA